MKRIVLPATLLLTSGLLVSGTTNAATTASTLNVSATITADCAANTTAVDFGNVVAGSGAVATGGVDVTCTLSTPYTIALDAGGNYLGNRRISDGSNFLEYTLAENTSALAWGDDGATISDASVAATGTGILQSFIVDAALIGGNVPAGSYSDTVNVTVTY